MGITASPPVTRPGLPRADAVLLRLELIGRMQALTLDNRSVLPLGRKTRALLAILALSNRRPVLRQRLAELLWSRRSEEQARASLRQEIHRLLDALSPLGADVVAVDRHMLALKPGLTSVDAERLLNAQPGYAGSLPSLDGVLLEELNGTDPALDQWLRAERQRLRQHALGLFETVLDRPRDPQGVLEGARQLLLIDPTHEAAWRATIRSRQALGETALAREAAERCAAALAERPNPPPAEETLRLLAEFDGTARLADLTAATETGDQDDAGPPRPGSSAFAADSLPDTQRRRRPGLPLLAILPLIDLNGRSDRRPLTHGLATALRAEMAPHGFLRVLSGSDLDNGLEDDRDDASLRRRFGIDYVLDGTIQGEGDQVRAVMRLTDIRQHGQIVWGRRFAPGIPRDGLLEHIVARVAAQVPAELMLLESHRLRRRPLTEMEPEQLSLRAFSAMLTSDRRQMHEAQTLLDRSTALGIETPVARLVDALAHLFAALQRWDLPASAARAAERSAAALEGSGGSVVALAVRVLVRSELDNEPEEALALADRIEALQPFALGTLAAVFPLLRLGRLRDARRRYDAARAVLPTHPFDMVLDLLGPMLALLEGRTEDAARLGLLASELHPCFAPALVFHLAALGQLDRQRDAARVRRQLLALWPDATAAMLAERAGLRDPEHANLLADGLRAAGLGDEPAVPPLPSGHANGAALGVPGAAG